MNRIPGKSKSPYKSLSLYHWCSCQIQEYKLHDIKEILSDEEMDELFKLAVLKLELNRKRALGQPYTTAETIKAMEDGN